MLTSFTRDETSKFAGYCPPGSGFAQGAKRGATPKAAPRRSNLEQIYWQRKDDGIVPP